MSEIFKDPPVKVVRAYVPGYPAWEYTQFDLPMFVALQYTAAAIDRNTAALERIAAALEARSQEPI